MKTAFLLVFLLGSIAVGDEKNPVVPLSEQIISIDRSVRDTALAQVREKMKTQAMRFAPTLAVEVLPAMLKAGLNEQAADLAMQGLLSGPLILQTHERLHQNRIKALLAMKKPQEALSEARSYFNVCSMSGTASALHRVTECLEAANPDDGTIVARFKLEQLAGATTQPATQPSTASMLKSIKVDAEPYLSAAKAIAGHDYRSLVRRGDLLLQADDIAGARQCFELAYKLATDKELREASESIARAMKAEDGTIGRANAWVLSIRPTTKPSEL